MICRLQSLLHGMASNTKIKLICKQLTDSATINKRINNEKQSGSSPRVEDNGRTARAVEQRFSSFNALISSLIFVSVLLGTEDASRQKRKNRHEKKRPSLLQ
jgi:hypothetical protein